MRTACSLLYGGGLYPGRLCPGGHCPGGLCTGGLCRGGLCASGGLYQGDPLERDPVPTVDRMTDVSKNITLPQTSFADGNQKKNKTKDFCSVFALSVADLRGHKGCTHPRGPNSFIFI